MPKHGGRRLVFFGLSAAVVAALFPGIPATAAPADHIVNPKEASIHRFVDRVQDRFGVKIDATDYEVRSNRNATFIVRKDALVTQTKILEKQAANENDRTGVSFFPGTSSPPTPKEAQKQLAEGDVTIQQETAWYEPTCWTNDHPPLTDPEEAGWMDACWQWGDMNYSGATRQNWAFRMYGTCKPGEANSYELVECYVDSVKHSTSAPLVWNDWSPKSTVDLGGCGQIQLQVGVGPVTGGGTISTCDKLVPERESEPADMRTRWVGDAYWKDEVRETGQIVGVGAAWNQILVIQPNFGYFYSSCTFGDITDLCG